MSHREMTDAEVATEKIARRIANERHGSEGLWQMYMYEANREVIDTLLKEIKDNVEV